MDLQKLYIKEPIDLYYTVLEFNAKPEFYKAAIGNAPKYFVHIRHENEDLFGLSKFCVLKGIQIEEYISKYRYLTDGNNSRLIIQNRLNKKWLPRNLMSRRIQKSFDNWISEFFPNYNVNNANFITVVVKEKVKRKAKSITPEELKNALDLQLLIGEIGEEIALEFEVQRLKTIGIKKPERYVNHISKVNSSAGFDISSISSDSETRFIEVKSSLTSMKQIFISENEKNTLESLGDKAYLYFVEISDLENKIGKVSDLINDPIRLFENDNKLIPVAYKVNI